MIEKTISVMLLAASLLQGSLAAAIPDKNINGTLFLVNREQQLCESYVPSIRKVQLNGISQSMRNDAATALEAMFAAAREDGIRLSTVSGYRSYGKQNYLYNRKIERAGIEVANLYVAQPGCSEHQTGLAMDIAESDSSNLSGSFGDTKEGQWVAENAHLYGFIVRYLEGMEDITGYAFEPWHIRYVGKDYATAIYEYGLPMEYYVSMHRSDLYTYLVQESHEVLP